MKYSLDREMSAACRRLVAPVHAALRASGINHRPFKLAALIVEASLARGRQFVYVLNARQLGELYGFSDSDIADILNGYSKAGHVMGLIEAKILRRIDAKEQAKGWLLVVNPDWSRWEVPMMHSPAAKGKWLGVVDAQARELERQMVSDEIEWQFPDLAALLSAQDVENALRLAADHSYVVASSAAPGADAPIGQQTNRPGVARPSCRVAAQAKDAPTGAPHRPTPAPGVATSEIPNAKTPEKPRHFGNSEPSRARTLSPGIRSSISALTLSVERLKELIRSGREVDFVTAMQAIIPTHENGDGGKWRAKWRQKQLRAHVVRTFEALIERIAEGTMRRAAGLEAHWHWRDYGGAAAEEKVRRLLNA